MNIFDVIKIHPNEVINIPTTGICITNINNEYIEIKDGFHETLISASRILNKITKPSTFAEVLTHPGKCTVEHEFLLDYIENCRYYKQEIVNHKPLLLKDILENIHLDKNRLDELNKRYNGNIRNQNDFLREVLDKCKWYLSYEKEADENDSE